MTRVRSADLHFAGEGGCYRQSKWTPQLTTWVASASEQAISKTLALFPKAPRVTVYVYEGPSINFGRQTDSIFYAVEGLSACDHRPQRWYSIWPAASVCSPLLTCPLTSTSGVSIFAGIRAAPSDDSASARANDSEPTASHDGRGAPDGNGQVVSCGSKVLGSGQERQ